ncbi:MAG TPA: response regulator transcription factor [Terrimesophilobacter sp.]|nr:response regulator transcription factor [Terrimesophilobacter sp.]
MATTGASVRLIDDHELVGVALEQALADSETLSYVGRVATVPESLAREPSPSIVVLDLRLADDSSPVENVQALTRAGCVVVIYTSAENPYLIRLAAQTPIAGLVRKSAPLTDLVTALERCARGELAFSTDWAAAILGDHGLDDVGMSPREREVLVLLAAGVPTKAAAAQLGIAVPTLEVHLRRLRDKYARIGRPAQHRGDLVLRALEDGYLPLPYEPPDDRGAPR